MHTRWASRGRDLTVASMDPYAVPIDVSAEVSARLNGRRDALIVLDCIGYRSDHAAHLSRMTGAAVLTARDAAIAMTGLLLQTLTDNRKDPYDPAASTRTVRSPRLPFRER